MSDVVYVIGHKNPDTDSIASSMAYAELKNKLGIKAMACRLGTLNEETKFATRFFDVEAPVLLKDARSTLSDIKLDEPVFIDEDATCNDAYKIILRTNSKTLYVINKDEEFLGIVSMGNLASLRLEDENKREELLKTTSIKGIANDLKAKIIYESFNFKTSGKVHMITRTSINKIEESIKDNICIVTDNEAVQIATIKAKAALVIVGYGAGLNDAVIELAKANDVSLIVSDMTPIEIIRIIYEAIPLKNIMTKKVISFSIDEYVEDVATKIANSRFRAYPVLDKNNKVVASLSRFHLFKHQRKEFILVDHSSKSQSIDNIDKAEIKEIIDHHHIGNIETTKPIYYRNELCGCTATIIYNLFLENKLLPEYKTAGMMLSAIISDTLYFKSETTTIKDKIAAEALSKLCHVDIDDYAKKLLNSSVNLKDGDAIELLKSDLKHYKFSKYNVAVGQTNYQNIEDIQLRIKDFAKAMQDLVEVHNYDLIIMMFTHVYAEGTMFMYYGNLSYVLEEVIESTFDEHSGYDHNIMSRKQQLIPALSEIIERS